MKHLTALAIIALAACSPAELGRRSVDISSPPTLPANCAELLELGRDCAVTVPPARSSRNLAGAINTPIARSLR